jgi:hypothetical protein
MGLDNVEGLFETVDVFDKSICEDYAHLEVKICEERTWKLVYFGYGFLTLPMPLLPMRVCVFASLGSYLLPTCCFPYNC